MEELENKIRSKTKHLTWEFHTEEVDDTYVLFTSSAYIGVVGVSSTRYVNREDQTDLVANLIVNRIRAKLLNAIF